MKKILLWVVVLTLLLPQGLLTAKGNDKGETLNLAPFVDFEVTEKQKIDVIVDIGTTVLTVNEVNSLINTTIRPKLAEKGLDYNIIVKDTNEGIDHFYLTNHMFNTYNNEPSTHNLYKYSIGTKKIERITLNENPSRFLSVGNSANSELFYDPKLNKLISPRTGFLDLTTKTSVPAREVSDYTITHYQSRLSNNQYSYYLQDGTMLVVQTYSGSINHMYTGFVPYKVDVDQNGYMFRRTQRETLLYYSDTNYRHRYFLSPKNDFYVFNDMTGGFYNGYYENGRGGFSEITKASGYSGQSRVINTRLYPNANFNQLNENEFMLYRGIPNDADTRLTERRSVFNRSENTFQEPTPYDHLNKNLYLQDERVFNYEYDNENQVYLQVKKDAIYIAEGFGEPYQKIEYPFTFNRPHIYDNVEKKGTFGDYVVIMQYEFNNQFASNMYLFNIETYEFTHVGIFYGELNGYNNSVVSATRTTNVFHYPYDYKAEKYLIKDVIAEQEHRYDAEVYYLRIDDFKANELAATNQAVEVVNAMSNNNMTFVGIAKQDAKASHDNMLAQLDGNGKVILNTNVEQAFNQAAEFIVNKKLVDLHLLDSKTSTLSATNLQNMLTQIKNEMRSDNYVVTTTYNNAVDNSFTGMLDQVVWDNYKNNYVVHLNHSSMTNVVDETYAFVAAQLNQNYAHLINYGNNSNKAKHDTFLSLINKGYTSQSTNLNSIKTEIKNHIIATAESNPKRHTRKLLLKHNPVTNEYSSEIDLQAHYFDHEGDRQKAERFKTEHDPTVYENHTGLMANTGIYRNSAITRFTKVGKYEIVVQKQDTPTNNKTAFKNYDLWSEDSLSRLVLYVHRQPVAQFQARFNSSGQFVLNDLSYDLDNYSKVNKGLMRWDWKYKRTSDTEWTIGKPSNLSATNEYVIALKVQDIDEAWSNEYQLVIGKNQRPIAYFEVNPSRASWTTNPIITDRSYSPSGLNIVERNWKVYREGKELLVTQTQPTVANIKTLANQHFPNVLGTYEIELMVRDSTGQLSEPYKTEFELINYEPIPNFIVHEPIYRDDVLNIKNLTAAKDLDNETVSFHWTFKKETSQFVRTNQHPSFTIKSLGMGKAAVGDWEVTLVARDTLNKAGTLTKHYKVLNHQPTSSITGDDIGYLNDVKVYTGDPKDLDSEDEPILKKYWKVTKPSGELIIGNESNLSLTFDEKGTYKLEHYVVDQLEDSSPLYTKEVTVLNRPPVADFTMLPNPTYRGVDITFKSLATDLDGYLVSHRYTAENEQGQTTLLSTEKDFVRSFSSVGVINVTQLVTDDDGESASITKQLSIINRKPVVEIKVPSSRSMQSPSVFFEEKPMLEWEYSDADQDVQVAIEFDILQRPSSSTGHFSSYLNRTFTTNASQLNTMSFAEETLYQLRARVYDGYDWSEWTVPHYFKLQLNSPPKSGFSYSPGYIFEGDTVKIRHNVNDSDGDILSVRYTVTDEAGKVSYFPSNNSSYSVASTQYQSFAFNYVVTKPQSITINQIVTDNKSSSVTNTQRLVVHPLTLNAEVRHTSQWELYRQRFNEQASTKQQWLAQQFYAGEKLMLFANTTDINYDEMDTDVFPVKVTVVFAIHNKTITLSRQGDTSVYTGEYYDERLNKLKNGFYDVLFTVEYSNGVIKEEIVQIEIIGEAISFIGVHRLK